MSHEALKVKRPYEFIVSTARVTNAEFTPNMMLHWTISSLGYKPLMWPSPAGHPDKDTYWMGPGAMLRRWKAIGTILWWKDFGVFKFDFTGNTIENLTYSEIVDYWSMKVTGKKIADKYKPEVVKLFSGESDPATKPELPAGTLESRLVILLQFLFSTPDFQSR
jgi:hypothetical protein